MAVSLELQCLQDGGAGRDLGVLLHKSVWLREKQEPREGEDLPKITEAARAHLCFSLLTLMLYWFSSLRSRRGLGAGSEAISLWASVFHLLNGNNYASRQHPHLFMKL